jgi:putative ABC transport system permease protein
MVRKEVALRAPDVPLFDVNTMQNAVNGGNGFFLVRMAAQFAAALGLLGLALAVVGLYGVVAYSAGQRTHEIGIRMALGAERRDILSMVVGHGVWLVVAGGAAGVVLALGLGRFMTSLLFDVKPYDPFTYAVVASVLVVVGTGACYLPARRATKVDPTIALRGA